MSTGRLQDYLQDGDLISFPFLFLLIVVFYLQIIEIDKDSKRCYHLEQHEVFQRAIDL